TGANDLKAPFANFHYGIDVSAPGVDVYSAYPDGRWAYWSGTSFSTGLVSGEAALLLSLRPESTRAELDRVISYSGLNLDRLNLKYLGKLGRVRVDFEDAVERLLRKY
ncbi:MAG: S8 family serine peptidase, partial [Acidobacteriota bacterium]